MKTRNARTRRSCAGFSLLEAIIAITILVMVVQAIASSALFASKSSAAGSWKTNALMQTQRTLNKIVNELRLCSSKPDPITGFLRYSMKGNPGDMVINFERVIEFANNGSELVPSWSTPVEYRIDNGNLMRTQDGESQLMMLAVDWFDVSVDALGRFHLEMGTSRDLSPTLTDTVRTQRIVTPMF